MFLTASGDEASVVTGLNMGADDYITEPFRPIITRQSGTVSAGNHPQGGAMFYIRFPK